MFPLIPSVVILGVSAIALLKLPKYWRKLIQWVKKSIKDIKIGGFLHFLNKQKDSVVQIIKKYIKKKDQWEETVITREISENEVPEDILRKAALQEGEDVDFTTEFKEELSLVS